MEVSIDLLFIEQLIPAHNTLWDLIPDNREWIFQTNVNRL